MAADEDFNEDLVNHVFKKISMASGKPDAKGSI